MKHPHGYSFGNFRHLVEISTHSSTAMTSPTVLNQVNNCRVFLDQAFKISECLHISSQEGFILASTVISITSRADARTNVRMVVH